MKLRLSTLFNILSIAALATSCGGDDSTSKDTHAATSCDDDKIGDDCPCDGDEDVLGKVDCQDDEIVCVCEDAPADVEVKPRDAGKKDSTVPKADAKAPTPKPDASVPTTDAGADEGEPDASHDLPPDPAPGDKPDPSKLPKVMGTCPELKDGTITIAGAKVQLTVGSKPGPVYLYFHGTGTSPSEIDAPFGLSAIPGVLNSVKSGGGIAASWDTSNNKGTTTGTIWYTGDMEAADQLIACGIEKGLVDTARIHVAGYSAGGLETGGFVVARSNYVASVIVYSGGKPFSVPGAVGAGGNVPSMVGAHGAAGSDSLGLDFGTQTPALAKEVVKAGGFGIDCDDGGGHVSGSRLGLGGKALDFFKAHPWGVRPWTAVPAGWPAPCKVVTK